MDSVNVDIDNLLKYIVFNFMYAKIEPRFPFNSLIRLRRATQGEKTEETACSSRRKRRVPGHVPLHGEPESSRPCSIRSLVMTGTRPYRKGMARLY